MPAPPVPLPFLEQLDEVERGALELEPVISSFLLGLEQTAVDLENALDAQPAERREALATLLDAVYLHFHDCHGLACDILEDYRQGDITRLRQSHGRLDHALATLHESCWIHRGPTAFSWANRIHESIESFLQGQSMNPELGALLDGVVLAFEHRGAARSCGPPRDLLDLLRRLADWARGSITLSRDSLKTSHATLPALTSRSAGWIRQSHRQAGLDGLIALLAEGSDSDEILASACEVLADIRSQEAVVEQNRGLSSQRSENALSALGHTLKELALTVEALVEDLEGEWEWDFHEQLRDLHDDLAEHMAELALASELEGSFSCPSCNYLNARASRRCHRCSMVLPAVAGEVHTTIDVTSDGGFARKQL